eukprot:UN02945
MTLRNFYHYFPRLTYHFAPASRDFDLPKHYRDITIDTLSPYWQGIYVIFIGFILIGLIVLIARLSTFVSNLCLT